MALGRAFSVAVSGVDGQLVEIEADIGRGLPGVHLVGLPDTALHESRDRVKAAVSNSDGTWPDSRVVLALSPATLPKVGSVYDLALAVAVLHADKQIPRGSVHRTVFLGELALDGRLRGIRGVLPAVLAAKKAGWTSVVVPIHALAEAGLVDGVDVFGARSLKDVVRWLRGEIDLTRPIPNVWDDAVVYPDMSEVVGQPEARWALEVAAAGAHHVMLTGPPGIGKTMLAQRLPGILPPLTDEEALEVTAIHSVAGTLTGDSPLISAPPFIAPHHSTTVSAMVGGGSGMAKPGAVSRAHRGVLFLDECAEIGVKVLESLRTPLEDGEIRIARRDGVARYPARFQLVLAANPCPCAPARDADCVCTPTVRRKYLGKLSGPLLDRVDLRIAMKAIATGALTDEVGESTEVVRARVTAARRSGGTVARLRMAHQRGGTGSGTAPEVHAVTRIGAPDRAGTPKRISDRSRCRSGVAGQLDAVRSGRRDHARHRRGRRGSRLSRQGNEMTTHSDRQLAWAYLSRVAQGPNRELAEFATEAGPEEARIELGHGRFGERLQVRAHIDTAEEDLNLVAALGGRLVTPDDDEWPTWQFLSFDGAGMPTTSDHCAPFALWVLGKKPLDTLGERAVSVVGTRAASAYGEHVTAEISGDLAVDGWTIVSGAAFGIDAAAHRSALGVGGTTVAVLACGIDRAYPSGHARLLGRIKESGAVVSEYAPGTTPAKHRFLSRNRLVAGFGSAVVVVEAGWRSGARNTAAWARKLGRPVLAVPGPVTSASSKGCHRMIREGEARLVADAHDVVAEAGAVGEVDEGRPSMFRDVDALSDSALRVYEALPASGTLSPRELSELSSLPLTKVRSVLPLLELEGFVASDETGWFRVVRM